MGLKLTGAGVQFVDRHTAERVVETYPMPFFRLLSAILLCSLIGCGISGYGASRSYPKQPLYHQVSSGDTLWKIADHYNVSTERLILLNGIRNPNRLQVGQRILVSYRSKGAGPAVATVSSSGRGNQGYIVPASLKSGDGGSGRLGWPVDRGRIVSRFGPRGNSFHDGIDIASSSGTPVYAAHSGVVVYSDRKLGGYGKMVIVRGDDRLITVYAHNRKLLVSAGERVRRGQGIAEVGSTGRSSGPHLHFEVRLKDARNRVVAVDPLPLLRPAGSRPRYRVNESLNPVLARR